MATVKNAAKFGNAAREISARFDRKPYATRITPADSGRINDIALEVYNAMFLTLDSEPGIDGVEAGFIAGVATKHVIRMLERLKEVAS